MINNISRFSFLALAYNHEKYVIEHLESIKYLVVEYGENIICNLIINDDCSEDNTVALIDKWLDVNAGLFGNVVKLYNKKNIGTCASILNMLNYIGNDAIKLTACDDVYSYENIFEYLALSRVVSIRSGIPLSLVDGKLFRNNFDILNIVAADEIYRSRPLADRFKFLSNNNAPNIIYNKCYLYSDVVKSFLSKYDVVEDWPIQVSISENFPETRFELIKKVFVYYRRTSGSAFIVAKGRFYDDKCRLYKYLIDSESNVFNRILLKNRLHLFKLNDRVLNKVFNFSLWVYLCAAIKRIVSILSVFRTIELEVSSHEKHYELINKKALEYY